MPWAHAWARILSRVHAGVGWIGLPKMIDMRLRRNEYCPLHRSLILLWPRNNTKRKQTHNCQDGRKARRRTSSPKGLSGTPLPRRDARAAEPGKIAESGPQLPENLPNTDHVPRRLLKCGPI